MAANLDHHVAETTTAFANTPNISQQMLKRPIATPSMYHQKICFLLIHILWKYRRSLYAAMKLC